MSPWSLSKLAHDRIKSSVHVIRYLLPSSRPGLGESEPRGPDLHRVFGHPQEPWHPPVQGSISGPGRVAAGAHQGHVGHRQRARQQRVGGQHPGAAQTWTRRQQVGNTHLGDGLNVSVGIRKKSQRKSSVSPRGWHWTKKSQNNFRHVDRTRRRSFPHLRLCLFVGVSPWKKNTMNTWTAASGWRRWAPVCLWNS